MKEYIIVANGPFLVREIIEEAKQGKIMVALDGAANKLKRIQIMPQVVLGDFDSVDSDSQVYWGIKQTFEEITNQSLPYPGNHGVTIVPAKDQDETDLVKAIRYCDRQQATSITIVCAAGGREDHYEGVKMALRTEYNPSRPIFLHTEQQTLRYARDETVELSGEIGDYCGVIATHTGMCTSRGLEYECENHAESICNRLSSSHATLAITGGALLIMPPQLASQRAYMCETEENRLKMQLRDATSKGKGLCYPLLKWSLFAVGAASAAYWIASSQPPNYPSPKG